MRRIGNVYDRDRRIVSTIVFEERALLEYEALMERNEDSPTAPPLDLGVRR